MDVWTIQHTGVYVLDTPATNTLCSLGCGGYSRMHAPWKLCDIGLCVVCWCHNPWKLCVDRVGIWTTTWSNRWAVSAAHCAVSARAKSCCEGKVVASPAFAAVLNTKDSEVSLISQVRTSPGSQPCGQEGKAAVKTIILVTTCKQRSLVRQTTSWCHIN